MCISSSVICTWMWRLTVEVINRARGVPAHCRPDERRRCPATAPAALINATSAPLALHTLMYACRCIRWGTVTALDVGAAAAEGPEVEAAGVPATAAAAGDTCAVTGALLDAAASTATAAAVAAVAAVAEADATSVCAFRSKYRRLVPDSRRAALTRPSSSRVTKAEYRT